MLKEYKKDLIILLFFFLLSALAYRIHYPVGTYDLVADQWNKGSILATLNDDVILKNDPAQSEQVLFRFNPEISSHILFVNFFKNYEQYTAFVSFLVYFIGLVLLYILVLILTEKRFLAMSVSIVFSSSTIWFSPLGDIFALIPVYGVCGKTFSYLLFIFTLIIYFKLKDYPGGDVITAFLCMVMIWVHSLTFLGPSLAVLTYILFKTFAQKRYKRATLIIGILLIMFLPYVFRYLSSVKPVGQISLSDQTMLIDALKKDYSAVWSPFSVGISFLDMVFQTNFLSLVACIVLILIIKNTSSKYSAFFFMISILTLANTFILRLFGTYILHNRNFYMLDRNIKWVYLCIFLFLVSLYNAVERNKAMARRMINPAFMYSLVIGILFVPQMESTFIKSSFGNKIAYKSLALIRSCGWLPFCGSDLARVNHDDMGEDLRDINKDVDALSDYIRKNIPITSGLAGPQWLNYKAFRPIAYHESMGRLFISGLRVNKYNKWIKIDRMINELKNLTITDRLLQGLKIEGIEYIVVEKFATDQQGRFLKYNRIPYWAEHPWLKQEFIEYENRNFILLKTS